MSVFLQVLAYLSLLSHLRPPVPSSGVSFAFMLACLSAGWQESWRLAAETGVLVFALRWTPHAATVTAATQCTLVCLSLSDDDHTGAPHTHTSRTKRTHAHKTAIAHTRTHEKTHTHTHTHTHTPQHNRTHKNAHIHTTKKWTRKGLTGGLVEALKCYVKLAHRALQKSAPLANISNGERQVFVCVRARERASEREREGGREGGGIGL